MSIQHERYSAQWHNSRRNRRQWQRRGRDRRMRRLDGRDRQVRRRRCGHRGLRIGERGEGGDGDNDVEEHFVFVIKEEKKESWSSAGGLGPTFISWLRLYRVCSTMRYI